VGVDPRFAHVGVTGLVDEAGRNAELGDDVADRAAPYWLMRSLWTASRRPLKMLRSRRMRNWSGRGIGSR
jgi:hypothetical protein